jgi:hypothetical protein
VTATTDERQPTDGAKRSHRAITAVLVVALGAGSVVGYSQSSWVRSQVRLSFSRRPAPFTELYFADPIHLPKVLSATAANQFSFTIVNHEGNHVDDRYRVTIAGPSGLTAIDGGTATLSQDESLTINERFQAPLPGDYLVTVALLNQPELVHFEAHE